MLSNITELDVYVAKHRKGHPTATRFHTQVTCDRHGPSNGDGPRRKDGRVTSYCIEQSAKDIQILHSACLEARADSPTTKCLSVCSSSRPAANLDLIQTSRLPVGALSTRYTNQTCQLLSTQSVVHITDHCISTMHLDNITVFCTLGMSSVMNNPCLVTTRQDPGQPVNLEDATEYSFLRTWNFLTCLQDTQMTCEELTPFHRCLADPTLSLHVMSAIDLSTLFRHQTTKMYNAIDIR
jgi:hypothetical protein